MSKDKMFNLLKKIGFTRTGGSDEELRCALILQAETKYNDTIATLQPFEVNKSQIEKVTLQDELGNNYEVSGYLCSSSTLEEGLKAPFYYMDNFDEVSSYLAKGCIVLVNNYLRHETYKTLIDSGAVGFITYSGDVYDTTETNDLDIRELREPLWQFGKIPGVHMRTKEAMRLVINNPKELTLTLIQHETKATSHNVIAEIKGTMFPDEIIAITAHYDSVYFSKGVYDNGAGSVIVMELYKAFLKEKPLRTMRFIWCGSEERGLLGSKAYINSLTDPELKKIKLCVNIDVGGAVLGTDMAIILGDESLTEMVKSLSKQAKFSIKVTQDIYSSDCIPFSDKGIPAINFMRFGTNGSAHIHDRYDTMYFLSAESLYRTYTFTKLFMDNIQKYEVFPINNKIPNNIIELINKYLKKEPSKS